MHKKHLIAVAVATGLAYFPVNANEYQASMVSAEESPDDLQINHQIRVEAHLVA